LDLDRSEYYPGNKVVISGKPSKLIYLEKFEIDIIPKTDDGITCGSFICGDDSISTVTVRPSPSGSFTHQFEIPFDKSSIGTYTVKVDADFETRSIEFEVLEPPSVPKLNTVIEKENRIAEKTIPIFTEEKNTSAYKR
jgi:hypothetical protein